MVKIIWDTIFTLQLINLKDYGHSKKIPLDEKPRYTFQESNQDVLRMDFRAVPPAPFLPPFQLPASLT